MATYITIPNATPEAEETLLRQPKTSTKLNRRTMMAAASVVLAMLLAATLLTSSAGASSSVLGEIHGTKFRCIKCTYLSPAMGPKSAGNKMNGEHMYCSKCDHVFGKDEARVVNAESKTVARFERRGGLYIARMRLKPPEGFPGPATR